VLLVVVVVVVVVTELAKNKKTSVDHHHRCYGIYLLLFCLFVCLFVCFFTKGRLLFLSLFSMYRCPGLCANTHALPPLSLPPSFRPSST
jgi:hypothetical protein